MRWMWIDSIVAFEPRARMVAIKNVSLAEEHLHDHFPAEGGRPAAPVMPSCLLLEGMAQTAGILVGSVHGFREKVVLAKVASATFTDDVLPGHTVRYDATLERIDDAGAATRGTIERLDHRTGTWKEIGVVELMFSHLDNNLQGLEFPEENFVFSENFRTILRSAGLAGLVS
jgi:3-hydroxyacyl-[acyl-carrier-protein] dehydratase